MSQTPNDSSNPYPGFKPGFLNKESNRGSSATETGETSAPNPSAPGQGEDSADTHNLLLDILVKQKVVLDQLAHVSFTFSNF